MARGDRRPRVLYPLYFDARRTRAQGRRLPLSEAVRNPVLAEIEEAARGLGLGPHREPKPHPSRWHTPEEGRVRVAWGGPKSELLHRVGQRLKESRRTN